MPYPESSTSRRKISGKFPLKCKMEIISW